MIVKVDGKEYSGSSICVFTTKNENVVYKHKSGSIYTRAE